MTNLYLSEEFERSLIQLKCNQDTNGYKNLNKAISQLIENKPRYKDWHTFHKDLRLSLKEANKFALFVKVLEEACRDDQSLNKLQNILNADFIAYAPVFDKIQNVLAFEDIMDLDVKDISLDLLLKEVDQTYEKDKTIQDEAAEFYHA